MKFHFPHLALSRQGPHVCLGKGPKSGEGIYLNGLKIKEILALVNPSPECLGHELPRPQFSPTRESRLPADRKSVV